MIVTRPSAYFLKVLITIVKATGYGFFKLFAC